MLPVRVITPHSGLDGFKYAISSLVKNFGSARSLAWRFFLRDTRAAHRQSLFGYLWILVPPLLNSLVWILLDRSDVIRIESGAVPYPVFVLAGNVLWNSFNTAIMAALGIVGEARGMLSKVNFPQEALIYTASLKALVEAAIPAVLLVPALLIYHIPLQSAALLFPLALLATLLLGISLGLILVPIASLYSDVGRAVQLALRFGFFFTPVIFALPASGTARQLMLLNPLSNLVVTGRTWLVGAGESMPLAFAATFTASLLLLAAGILIFKVALPHLIERLSS